MAILRRIQHDIKMRRLRKNFNYVIGKMKEHEQDADPSEWKKWASLNLVYLGLMEIEVNEYALKIGRRKHGIES